MSFHFYFFETRGNIYSLLTNLTKHFFFLKKKNSHQTLKKDEFYALLSVADLAVITPLRDGMNTTSMEFVIAQESTNKSPVVLSEFMGISKNMEDSLLVNPWNLGVCVFPFLVSIYSSFLFFLGG